MPVHRLPQALDEATRYRRLSASQLAQWRACARRWWHERVDGLRGPVPPPLMIGHAVEEAIFRVLRESPALVAAAAPADLLTTPLDADGRPDARSEAAWRGPELLPLPAERWPADRATLEAWTDARLTAHWPGCWSAAEAAWEADPNREGDWPTVDAARAEQMARAGIHLQLDEVAACLVADGGPHRAAWAAGERPRHPPPDGFPPDWSRPPTSSSTWGWTAAWDLARPWFVDPDAAPFTLASAHPEGWFQGEYDLVHTWDGTIRIIDLKASAGMSPYSQWYPDQLELYAWLWSRTHGGGPIPTGLALWYLDGPHIKAFKPPDEARLRVLDTELAGAHDLLFKADRSIADFPPEPAAWPSFGPGGELLTKAGGTERCDRCHLRRVCERWPERASLPAGGLRRAPDGRQVAFVPLGEVRARHTARGRVLGDPWQETDRRGTKWWFLTLQDDSDSVKVACTETPAWPAGTTQGDALVIDRALARRWSGRTELIVDEHTCVMTASEAPAGLDVDSLLSIRTVVDVRAEAFSLHPWTGEGWDGSTRQKWEVRVVDSTGVAAITAWNEQISGVARTVRRGDTITAYGVEVGEFSGRLQLTLGRQGRLMVEHRDD